MISTTFHTNDTQPQHERTKAKIQKALKRRKTVFMSDEMILILLSFLDPVVD
jgi:hypothetical protein